MTLEVSAPVGGSSVEVKTGTYVGDDVNGRDIVTGLTKPIKFLWVLSENTASPDQSYYSFKSSTMPGRKVALPASTFSSMNVLDGASFVGSDFNVRTDDLGFNFTGNTVYHWVAIGF